MASWPARRRRDVVALNYPATMFPIFLKPIGQHNRRAILAMKLPVKIPNVIAITCNRRAVLAMKLPVMKPFLVTIGRHNRRAILAMGYSAVKPKLTTIR